MNNKIVQRITTIKMIDSSCRTNSKLTFKRAPRLTIMGKISKRVAYLIMTTTIN